MKRLKKYLLPLLAALIAVCLIVVFAQRQRRAAPAGSPQTVTVKAGQDLQKALDAARPGDTILVEAGATYIGPFTLPNKGAGDAYITIQSTRAAELPDGVRVTPQQAGLMPKLLSPGRGAAALQTAPGAHHYRFVGVEFTRTTPDVEVFDLIKFGDGSAAQNKSESVPHHLALDRCYVHGDSGDLKRGISLQSAHTDILNSYISEFHVRGQEAQAVAGWNGPGPFRLINNYLEGAGENVMFGGAEARIPGLVPSDIEIRRNHFNKPPSWRGRWTVKNILELKNARRVTIDGNLFEHCWLDAQQGYAILFTPRPNDSGAWAVVEDVEFTNNIVRHVAAALHVMGQDSIYAAGPTERRLRRVRIANNLFEDVNHAAWGGDGAFLKIISGADEVTVEHNTVLQTGNIIKSSGDAMNGFIFRDNIVRHNEYGVHGDGVGYGNPALAKYFPGARFINNVIVKELNAPENVEKVYPPQNMFPRTMADVGFTNVAARDYRLAPGSRHKRKGSEGSDPGCDFEKLNAATGIK